ncbi:hypothetical protein PMIN02_013121 [Paraphaeosphaeria minitans]
MYVVVDRSQTTSGGEGTAGCTFSTVKWGMSISFGSASAVCQTSASGHSCTKPRLKPSRFQSINQSINLLRYTDKQSDLGIFTSNDSTLLYSALSGDFRVSRIQISLVESLGAGQPIISSSASLSNTALLAATPPIHLPGCVLDLTLSHKNMLWTQVIKSFSRSKHRSLRFIGGDATHCLLS